MNKSDLIKNLCIYCFQGWYSHIQNASTLTQDLQENTDRGLSLLESAALFTGYSTCEECPETQRVIKKTKETIFIPYLPLIFGMFKELL